MLSPVNESLLLLTARDPAALFAWTAPIIERATVQMPGVDPAVFAAVREWNAVLWHAYAYERESGVPAAMGALIFWWMATAHRGVFEMVRALASPADATDAYWLTDDRLEHFYAFVGAWVLYVKKGPMDAPTLARNATLFHAAFSLVYFRCDVELAKRDVLLSRDRVTKDEKARLNAATHRRVLTT